jgi:hypothetical protein
LFPRKISKSLNGYLFKAVVREGHWDFIMNDIYDKNSNKNVVWDVEGLEIMLLRVVLQQMNMTFVHVYTPKGFEMEERSANNLIMAMTAKEVYIGLGDVFISYFDFTNTYCIMSVRW